VSGQIHAVLKTTYGNITIRLLPLRAPKTVRNFVELAEGTREWKDPATGQPGSGPYYDGTLFFRVMRWHPLLPLEMRLIWGGDPLNNGRGGPGYKFADEIDPGLTFDQPYLLGMANAGPGTNGSQFFITAAPCPELTGKHTIFGNVSQGTEVVDRIANVPTGANDRPVTDVVLQSVTINRAGNGPIGRLWWRGR